MIRIKKFDKFYFDPYYYLIMKTDSNMGRFFDWLAKPMNQEDIDAWYLANNIIPEYTELFRDFCISFLNLLNETYLGDNFINTDTKVLMNEEQNRKHFKWCWNKTIENFDKEEIRFVFALFISPLTCAGISSCDIK